MSQNKILVENKHGHGAKIQSPFLIKVKRALRPKFHKTVGRAGIPFDWVNGFANPKFSGLTLKVKNQGQRDSCKGEMRTRALQQLRIATLGINEELSSKADYSLTYAPGGGTTDYNAGLDIGAVLESEVPSYDAYGNPLDESGVEDTSWVNAATQASLNSRKGYIKVTVKIDIESIAQAYRDLYNCNFMFRGQNNGSWLSPFPKPPVSNSDLWGHFMAGKTDSIPPIVKFNYKKTVPVWQSWGEQVGENGVQYFQEDYINSKYMIDVFAYVPTKTLKQMKIGIIQQMLILLQQLKQLITN